MPIVAAARQGLWRGAPVAVKYTRCDTSDAAALEQCIREAVLSRRMSHPHVVQTFAWTVLTADDAAVRCLCCCSAPTLAMAPRLKGSCRNIWDELDPQRLSVSLIELAQRGPVSCAAHGLLPLALQT